MTYKSCPEGCRRVAIFKHIIVRTFNYVEQNGHLKSFIGCVWGNCWRLSGLFALQSLSTFKRALALSIFSRMSYFQRFYDNNNHLQIKIGCISGNAKYEGRGIYPPIILNLKIHYSFQLPVQCPLQRLYDHPFYKYLICPQGITYNPCPEGFCGFSSSKK